MDLQSISILGCGWYGLALAKDLIQSGYNVKGSTTGEEKIQVLQDLNIAPFIVRFEHDLEKYQKPFFDCDALIVSIPPKRRLGEAMQYVDKIKRIRDAALERSVKKVIFISSTSVYGDCNCELDEDTLPVPQTESGKAILEAEGIFRNSSLEVTVIRFGGLVGPGRDPARFFAGKKNIPNGKSPVNLIALDDCVGITKAILEKNAFGYTFNACASNHPEKMNFYTRAAIQSGLEVPEFISELADWKIVNSKYLNKVLNYTPREL